jgi:hypothetical protein
VTPVEPRLARPISFVFLGWEVVQSVVHQPLELTILVRVQASQPIENELIAGPVVSYRLTVSILRDSFQS